MPTCFTLPLWVFFVTLTFLMPYSWKVPGPHLIGIYIGIGIFGYLTLLFLDKALTLAPAALTAPLIYSQLIWVFSFLISCFADDHLTRRTSSAHVSF